MDNKTVVTSAFTVTIDDTKINERIDTIRSKYDKAYPRWMPHINLFFPFFSLETFKEFKQSLQDAFKDFESFTVTLDKVDFFSQGKDRVTKEKMITYNLRCEKKSLDNMKKLFTVAKSQLKINSKKEFIPHLTLGQSAERDKDMMLSMLNETFKDPITFRVTKICVLQREKDSNFEVVDEINLKN
jgi:2'-5' RNA ligase